MPVDDRSMRSCAPQRRVAAEQSWSTHRPNADDPVRVLSVPIVMPLAEQRGGGELMLLHLMQQGRSLGINWSVLFLEDGPMLPQVQALGVKARVLSAGRLRRVDQMVAAVRSIARALREQRAHAVLAWMGKAQLYASPAAVLAGVPSVWYQLGMPRTTDWMDVAANVLPARGVLTCSRAGADAQARLSPRRPIRIVHPGAELERFQPDSLPAPIDARRRLGLPLDGPLIGIVGRLQRWKGMHHLVAAMPEVLRHRPDARCVIVGGDHPFEPDYLAELRRTIESLGLGDRVLLAGLQRNVPEWVQAMDVFVHASANEPFGIAIVEAMALGKPVIATDRAGPTEIITHGIDGMLHTFGSVETLAKSIVTLLADPDFARRLGAAAQKRARDFSTERYAVRLVEALRELLAQRPERHSN
jgi:hypothetical protein